MSTSAIKDSSTYICGAGADPNGAELCGYADVSRSFKKGRGVLSVIAEWVDSRPSYYCNRPRMRRAVTLSYNQSSSSSSSSLSQKSSSVALAAFSSLGQSSM